MFHSIGRQLIAGFGATVLVLGIAVGISIWQISEISTVSTRLSNLRTPTAEASLEMQNGVNHSLAALRGYVVLGKDRFKVERLKAWTDEITPSLQHLNMLSENWTNPENQARLIQIQKKVMLFKRYQQEIEAIARTPANRPDLLLAEGAVHEVGTRMMRTVTALIDTEKVRPANDDNKQLLSSMGDFRASLAMMRASLLAYLLTGKSSHKADFEKQQTRNTLSFFKLKGHLSLMTSRQQRDYQTLSQAYDEFLPLPEQIFLLRERDNYDIANDWLASKAAPLAFEIKDINWDMVRDQRMLREHDFAVLQSRINRTTFVEYVLLIFGILGAVIAGSFCIRSLLRSLGSVKSKTNLIAKGDLTTKVTISGAQEMQELGEDIEAMRKALLLVHEEQKALLNEQQAHGRLSEILQKSSSLDELSVNVITFLSDYTQSQVGAFYVRPPDKEDEFHLAGTYAFTRRKQLVTKIASGTGLVSEAVIEKQSILISDVPDDYIHVSSGFGEAVPHHVLVVPVLRAGHVKGVLELGSFELPSERLIHSLESMGESIAIALDVLQATVKTEGLLATTQQQTETLQRQQEKMAVQNEELREQTDALMSSREQLTDFQHQVEAINYSQCVIQFHPDGRIIWANSIFLDVMGYTAKEVIDQHHRMFVSDEMQNDAGYQEFWQDLAAGRKKSGEFSRLRKDGQIVWLQATYTPIKDPTDTVFKVVKYATDITEQKLEIERHNQEMEQAKNALEAKARELVQTSQYKGEFLATMSHEIRTPMNGILGMTEIILDSSLDSDQRDCVETVKHSANALLTILNDILDFSKIESGKLDIEVIDFDLRVVVDEVMELLGAKAQEKGLELVGLVHATVPRAVRGDPGRFRQILLNLAGNAIKFTEHGEVLVQVSSEAETADSVQLRVEVRDTGIGLAPDTQDRLFQPFTQSDSSTTRRFGGTGLGLSICKQLVELMGGDIHVDSQSGQGSQFWFTIQLQKQHNPEVSAINSEGTLKGLRACIVDDNESTRQQLFQYLMSWGLSCIVAENGAAALLALQEAARQDQPCDLLIFDRDMPGMDGLALAQEVKANPDLSRAHMVMLTGMGHRGDAADAQEAGIKAYVTKPIQHDRLRKCLSLLFNGSAVADGQIITQHTVREAVPRTGHYVLVAEDNLVNQKVVVRMLKKLSYRVDVVANGREAVEAVTNISYDAVLMDCQMPEMDGYEATRAIRAREASEESRGTENGKHEVEENERRDTSDKIRGTRRLPIIALTANAMKGDRERCLEAGMDDFLSKPVKSELLQAALERCFQESKESSHEIPESEPAITIPSIDPQTLQELRSLGGEDDPEFVNSVIEQFLTDLPNHAAAIRSAISQQDPQALMKAAHACKGSCRNMGALVLAEICLALESLGQTSTVDGALAWEVQLEAEIPRLQIALQRELEKTPSPVPHS